MSAHTPGPWEIAGATHIFAGGDRGANIASVSSPRKSTRVGYWELELGDPDSKEAYANARLIAAAPELLECLLFVCDYVKNGEQTEGAVDAWIDRATAAIAKATGAA